MEMLPILSKAQVLVENEMMCNVRNPAEILPLMNRWLEEYSNITSEEFNQLHIVTQKSIETKYLIAQRISLLCEEIKRLLQIIERNRAASSTSSQTTDNSGSASTTSANLAPATVASPNPANQLNDDEPSTSRSARFSRNYENVYSADPRKRVLRELNRQANLSETSTSTNIQCEDHAASSSESSVTTSTENFASGNNGNVLNGTEETSSSGSSVTTSTENTNNSIVDSDNNRNVPNDTEETQSTNSSNVAGSVAAYETVATSAETNTVSTNSAESDDAASMSTTIPALSPPIASSTPMPMPSPPTAENAVHCTVIGPNGTIVPTEKFNAISFTSSSAATRSLLCMIFPEEVLATHTLSGKPSPAFLGNDRVRPQKGQLDPKKVEDIMHCVMSRTSCSDKEVRMTITTKCADSTKKFRRLGRTPRRND